MSISGKTGQQAPLTQVNPAIQHFTDRHEITALFAKYLNDDDLSPKKILFFYGDGGNGKSLLLKFLRENCCKRFSADIWQQQKTKTSSEVAGFIKTVTDKKHDFKCVPAALLDFAQQPVDEDRPQDPFYGLLMLRRELVKAANQLGYQLNFPLTDYACIWYLKQKGKLTNEFIVKLFPSPELFVTGGIVNLFKTILGFSPTSSTILTGLTGGLGLAGALTMLAASTLNVISKYFGKDLTLYLRGRGLKQEDFQRITQLDPDKELIDALPNFFVEDLQVAMKIKNAPERLVLFFDTHESFWGDWHNRGKARFFKQDEWLRCILAQLDSPKIVVAVAGREIPRWEEASQWRISKDKLECKEVLNFQKADALRYLHRVGIEDTKLCESLIAYASFDDDLVHPLLLGLCADIVISARDKGEILMSTEFQPSSQIDQKLEILVERLLKYVDEELENAIYVLSACRAFNEELYFELGKSLPFDPTHAAFNTLIRFSFVWSVEEEGQNWYRLHPLVRRLNLEQQRKITQDAHQFLEKYYQRQGNVAEEIYHAYWQDEQRGMEKFIEVFKIANQQEKNELCRILAEIEKEFLFCPVKSPN